jgi:hypothetical protein
VIVPVTEKLMVSFAADAAMVSRNVPGPLSLRLVTVRVVAEAVCTVRSAIKSRRVGDDFIAACQKETPDRHAVEKVVYLQPEPIDSLTGVKPTPVTDHRRRLRAFLEKPGVRPMHLFRPMDLRLARACLK